MKRILFILILLKAAFSGYGDEVSYLPANPRLVRTGIVILDDSKDREILIKLIGICEPIHTRVIKKGDRFYHEPVHIENGVDIATIKVLDLSEKIDKNLFPKTHRMIIDAYYKPGQRQYMRLSNSSSKTHLFRWGLIKTEEKWTNSYASGIYNGHNYSWKGATINSSIVKTDWLLIVSLILFFLVLFLPNAYTWASESKWFPTWAEKHKKLCDWLEDTGGSAIWFISILVILSAILACQWIIFLICLIIAGIWIHRYLTNV